MSKNGEKVKLNIKLDGLHNSALSELAGKQNASKSEIMERLIFNFHIGNIELNDFKKKNVTCYLLNDLEKLLKDHKMLLSEESKYSVSLKSIYFSLIEYAKRNENSLNSEGIYIQTQSIKNSKEDLKNADNDKNKEDILNKIKNQKPIKIRVSKEIYKKIKEDLNDESLEYIFKKTDIGNNLFCYNTFKPSWE